MAISDDDRRRIAEQVGQPVPQRADGPDAAEKQAAQRAALYKWLWMADPPVGEIEATASMNIYEFEAHQREKPAFKMSPRFKEEEVLRVNGLAQRIQDDVMRGREGMNANG